jgi:hypothetical protein
MLDGLDHIDWSQLSHAFGPATDVPARIRQLADGSSDVRERALAELLGTIWHQGTVYEATPYAVPFLIELATDPAIPDRSHVLALLHTVADGWLDRQKYAVQPGKFVAVEAAERKAIERRRDQAAHAAVAEGLTALSDLLTDEEPEVRGWTASVLALLTGHAAEVAEKLLEVADREDDDACRSAIQFALAALAVNAAIPALTDVVVRRLTSVFNDPPSEVVALGAGIALLQLEQDVVIPRVLHLARPRLVSQSHVFEALGCPGSATLYELVYSSLKFAPREQLTWIVEGLNHTDREVRSMATGFGVSLCEEFRWGPGELIPLYAQLIERVDADERKTVLLWMRSLGAAGAAMLESFQQHRLPDVRENAAAQLKRIESNRQERESWLLEKRPDVLPSVAALVKTLEAHQTSRKWHDEKLCEAVIQLGFHGQRAHPAVESLRALTERENPWIRVHSIRALWRITRNPDLIVPLVQANLDPHPVAFSLLDCLQQMGSGAQAVAPELRRILDAQRRFFRQGWSDHCALDEAFCDTCAATLRAIEAPG